jgi:hypothetical protein
MKLVALSLLVLSYCASMTNGFAPMRAATKVSIERQPAASMTKLLINIGDQERDKLTRDSEPEDYFKT